MSSNRNHLVGFLPVFCQLVSFKNWTWLVQKRKYNKQWEMESHQTVPTKFICLLWVLSWAVWLWNRLGLMCSLKQRHSTRTGNGKVTDVFQGGPMVHWSRSVKKSLNFSLESRVQRPNLKCAQWKTWDAKRGGGESNFLFLFVFDFRLVRSGSFCSDHMDS